MKHQNRSFAVALLVLLYATIFLICIECPATVSEKCICTTWPDFFFECTDNIERVSIFVATNRLVEFNCTNVLADSKIHKLFNFGQKNFNFRSDIALEIHSCPMSTVQWIENSIVSHTKQGTLRIEISDLSTFSTINSI